MKIVAINGSPRGRASNTAVMINAFLKGLPVDSTILNFYLAEKHIENCKGCYGCWQNPTGCVQKDDFNAIIQEAANTDLILWGTPIYFSLMSGLLKNFIDRLTSTGNPHNPVKLGTPKFVMLANCGYPNEVSFDLLSEWIKGLAAMMQTELSGEYYFTSGKTLADPDNEKARDYLTFLENEGARLTST